MTRAEFLELISKNIKKSGFHLTSVIESTDPAFIYSIGLSEKLGYEIIFAGGAYFNKEQKSSIIREIVKALEEDSSKLNSTISTKDYGKFELRNAKYSWCEHLTLGVFDYYDSEKVDVYQLVPEKKYFTYDIPNMLSEWNNETHSAWQWLTKEWEFDLPKNSKVATNLNALQGYPVTEIMRWEEDYWEMFSGAGPDVKDEDTRIVPIGTIFGIDRTIAAAFNLTIKEGIWRESRDSNWNKWK